MCKAEGRRQGRDGGAERFRRQATGFGGAFGGQAVRGGYRWPAARGLLGSGRSGEVLAFAEEAGGSFSIGREQDRSRIGSIWTLGDSTTLFPFVCPRNLGWIRRSSIEAGLRFGYLNI